MSVGLGGGGGGAFSSYSEEEMEYLRRCLLVRKIFGIYTCTLCNGLAPKVVTHID